LESATLYFCLKTLFSHILALVSQLVDRRQFLLALRHEVDLLRRFLEVG
jgi:hypothetical protein